MSLRSTLRPPASCACLALALLSLLALEPALARGQSPSQRRAHACRKSHRHLKRRCTSRRDRLSRRDSTPPSRPTGLEAAAGDGQASLSWSPSHDNVGVAGYRVYRDRTRVASTTRTSFVDAGLTNGATYSYSVRSFDAAHNLSPASDTVMVTPHAAPAGSPSPGGGPTTPIPSAPNPGGPQTSWTPPGSSPLSDWQAAALVVHRPEQRPDNAQANDYVPSDAELAAFYDASNQYGQSEVRWNPGYARVTGRPGLPHPSTDDLIQWVAHKWGIPEDWIRAQLVQESWWHMSQLGDPTAVPDPQDYPPQSRIDSGHVYQSLGIAQVRWAADGSQWPGTEPLRWKSTAFNLDFYAATLRYYYDGRCDWCGPGYGPGQQWASVGAWFNPDPWNSSQSYVHDVQGYLNSKPWRSSGF